MPTQSLHTQPVDRRIRLYRLARSAIVFAVVIIIVKFLLVDTYRVDTDQMSPALRQGDRIAMIRAGGLPLLRRLFAGMGGVVVLSTPWDSSGSLACLRIAGCGGDSVAVEEGRFLNFTRPHQVRAGWAANDEILPADFSPADWMQGFRIPRAGSTWVLDTLSTRDFLFVASAIGQENPGSVLSVRASMFVDGKETHNYSVGGFSLFEGSLEEVPRALQFDPAFWERLQRHIAGVMPEKHIWFSFSLERDGAPVLRYRFKESCIFVLADDWRGGHDSRYFGPVSLKRVKGRVALVLWSVDTQRRGPGALRLGRIARILR